MHGTLWSPQQVARLTELFYAGVEFKDIGAEFGLSEGAVGKKAWTLGLRRGHAGNTRSKDDLDKIASLWRDGKAVKEIAHALGVTKGVISGIIHRQKFKRDPSVVKKPKTKVERRPRRGEAVKHNYTFQRKGDDKIDLLPHLPQLWDYPSPFPRDDMDLCPWPLWSSGATNYSCCGAFRERFQGVLRSYCARHQRMAYR